MTNTKQKLQHEEIIADQLEKNGYCIYELRSHIDCTDKQSKFILKDAFNHLTLDLYSTGNRYRNYIQVSFSANNEILFGKFEDYLQTKQFNPITGGVIRNYPDIDISVLTNKIFLEILNSDIELVNNIKRLPPPSDMLIGIHLFRYRATLKTPSFSSPSWLHKDDEDIVFVHLIDKSESMLGGENIVATDAQSIERVNQFLDTFVVNHHKFHAVTPISPTQSHQDTYVYRDVILVTFQQRNK